MEKLVHFPTRKRADSRISGSTCNNGIFVHSHIIASILHIKGRNLECRISVCVQIGKKGGSWNPKVRYVKYEIDVLSRTRFWIPSSILNREAWWNMEPGTWNPKVQYIKLYEIYVPPRTRLRVPSSSLIC